MTNILKDLFADDTVRLIFMGSSVTDGYPYDERVPKAYPILMKELLENQFPNKKIQIENLASCGEKTAYGLMTCEEKLMKYDAGIVFLDYALNDKVSKDWMKMYEGMVRKIIRKGLVPVSMVLPGKDRSAAFRYIKKVSAYYKFPCICVDDLIAEIISKDNYCWEELYLDSTHPNEKGHGLIAKLVTERFLGFLEEEENISDTQFTKELLPGSYENMKIIKVVENDIFRKSFELECKTVWVSYKQHYEKSMGKLQVLVDGNLVENLHGRSHFSVDFSVQKKLFEFEYPEKHTITFQMAPGDEEKRFVLEMIGYC